MQMETNYSSMLVKLISLMLLLPNFSRGLERKESPGAKQLP